MTVLRHPLALDTKDGVMWNARVCLRLLPQLILLQGGSTARKRAGRKQTFESDAQSQASRYQEQVILQGHRERLLEEEPKGLNLASWEGCGKW